MKNILLLIVLLYSTGVVTKAQTVVWELTNLTAFCPAIYISANGFIYAGTNTGDVYKSTDNGNSWTHSTIGVSYFISDIKTSSSGLLFIATTENGIYRSSDDGATWHHLTPTAGIEARDIYIKDEIIFVSTKDHGLGKSTDNGNTWSGTSGSVPENNIGAFNITNNGTLLIGVKGSNGLYRSTDNGATWSITNFPTSYRVYSLTVASNNFIFAGTAEHNDGIYRSTDDGITWQKLATSSSTFEYKSNGIFTSDGILFVGVINSGIYGSTDLGNSWNFYNDGLLSLIGFKFAEASNGTVFATTGSGVYKNTGTTDIHSEYSINNFQLNQNYPNPFNPNTVISFQISERSNVALKIYDILGNEITNLVNEEKEAGTYNITFSAEGISSGVYYYQLITSNKKGNFIETKKMIFNK